MQFERVQFHRFAAISVKALIIIFYVKVDIFSYFQHNNKYVEFL